MASYTTTDFLASVRQRGALPTTTNSNNVNNTSNLLALATEELHIKLLPLIMSVREEFYVAKKAYSITANQAEYAIPSRASGVVLRDVQMIVGTSIFSLEPVDSEHITTTAVGDPVGYYLEHQNVVLYPTPGSTADTLRLRYFMRPSRLALTSACAQISAINTGTNTVTVSSVPSTWTTGTSVDFIKATPPYQNPAIDQSITGVSGSDITFASLPSDLAVGDWIALAEYTPIPQVPFEFQPVLAQMTVVKALEAIGDREGAAAAKDDLKTIQQAALMLVTPRVQGSNKKVIGRNWR
jgi:hypothetical protein